MAASPRYRHLQTAAFRLRPDAPLQRRMYLLRFPEAWKKPLTTLSKPRRDGKEHRSVPIRLLNEVLAALVPDVITVATKATIGEQAPWIYSDTEVDTRALFSIVAAWVRAYSSDRKKTTTLLEQLDHGDLHWETRDINFTTLTSDPGDDEERAQELYRLLPHVLAAELSNPALCHEHYNPPDPNHDPETEDTADTEQHSSTPRTPQARSWFHRVPAPQGAAVMNWPPHRMPARPLSFLLRITTQTRAFDDQPVIHLSVGTRRWAHKDSKLSFNRDHSVYLLPEVPWIKGIEKSRSFLVAGIESWKKPAPDTDEGFEYSARWSGGKIGRILADLGLDARLPDPDDIKKTPARGLTKTDAAALVYRNGMYSFDHPVAPGASLADKVPLVDWVSSTLSPYLERIAPLPRGNKVLVDRDELKAGKYGWVDPARLRAAIAETVGPTLGVDIFYDTRQTRQDACTTLATLLDVDLTEAIDAAAAATVTVVTDELTIVLTVRPVGRWGGSLAGDESLIGVRDRLQAAVTTRVDTITDSLGTADLPTVSIVEIKGRKSYSGKLRAADPKFAIKVGLSRTLRLSQCVTASRPAGVDEDGNDIPPPKSNLEKMTSSWYDLLRQLGVRVGDLPVKLEGTSITQAPAYLAFWLIRQNRRGWEGITRQIPVAVLIDPSGRSIKVHAPNVGWMPLHQAQHEISRLHMLTDQTRTPEEITRFFEGALRSVARQHPSLLLLTCAQNLRWGWPHLNNLDMAIDTIKFGTHPQNITRYPGLRHIRVRTTERDEVPDTYAVNATKAGHAPGYWPIDDRTYYSTGEKPHSAGKATLSASKIVLRWRKGKPVAASTKAMVWNARAVETTVAGMQPGDNAEDWAALAHGLRWATSHYDYAVSLPWPLAIARKLGEYVMPVELLEDLEEEDTSGADQEAEPQ
ncbi:pPIWI_RE module domain-containing protein [Allokutzneria oryzae]|uniref:PPIWI_RE module domain-containing protein n=1 Tax=Allokutzneria oryzae TaxID=1378989 RepID=A0ABV5ZPP4_9PSEU